MDHQHALTLRAAEILGSPLEAQDWLRRPAPALDDQRPGDLLGTPEGRQLLDGYLTALELGGGRVSEP